MMKFDFLKIKPYQKEILVFLSFVILAFLIFFPSFLNQNYFWDDERFIFMNPGVLQAPSWTAFWNMKSEFFKSWPLGYSVFWTLIKYSPFQSFNFYKSLNIIFHGFNAFLILKVVKKFNFPYPLLLALVFLVHPLQVETVSWIFQLLTILSFTFFLISFLFLLKFTTLSKKRYLLLSLLFFVFSLWTKSIAILSPFLFVTIFWISNLKKKQYLFLIPFFVASFYVGFLNIKGTRLVSYQAANQKNNAIESAFDYMNSKIRIATPESNIKIKNDSNTSLFDFIYNQKKEKDVFIFSGSKIFNQASWHYFSKSLIPLNLQFIYQDRAYSILLTLFSLIALFIFPIILCFKYKNKIFTLIPVLSFIFLVPYLGVTNIAFFYWSNVSDRYAYFFIIVLVFSLGLLGKKYKRLAFEIFLSSYCLFLALQCLHYGFKFNRPLELYKEIIEYKPHPVLYSLLFEQYYLKLDEKNAEKTLNEAHAKFPIDPQYEMNRLRLESLKSFQK